MMRKLWLLFVLWAPLAWCDDGWRVAAQGWQYQFPRDHHAHSEFKTEWWYFTGNLTADDGARFGFELTFFREGIRPRNEREPTSSRFIVNDVKFAHFALTDVAGKRFLFDQKTSRGSFNDAGFDQADRIAWIEDWSLRTIDEASFELSARSERAQVHLTLKAGKPPAIHGANGVSRKGEGAENASHYYSMTRLETSGAITIEKTTHNVRGESWFDHEWATNQLGANQVGWDWLSVQLGDGRELMLYRMRLENGSVDPASSGTLIEASGQTVHLAAGDFEMVPIRFWKSGNSAANYPIEWRVKVPKLGLQFLVRPLLDSQELDFKTLTYWEGAIDVSVEQNDATMKGSGYLELTGYAAPLRQLMH